MKQIQLCLLLATLTIAAPISDAGAQMTNLRYGQIPSTIKTVSALQFHIAQRKNFFSREGLTLEMVPIDGGAANVVVALTAGAVEITRTATPYLIQDVLSGSDNVAEELVRIVTDTTGSSEQIARQTLSLYFDPDRGVIPKRGEIDVKGFGEVIRIMEEVRELKPPLPAVERFIDLQFLKAAAVQ